MDASAILYAIGSSMIVFGLLGYIVGDQWKGRGLDGALLGLFLGVFGLAAVGLLSDARRKCSKCGSTVAVDVAKCRHCGSDLIAA